MSLLGPAQAHAADLSRRELLALAMSGRYEDLDAALSSLQSDYERAPDHLAEDRVDRAFVAFRNSKSGLEAQLIEWRNRNSASCSARLALGNHQLSLAEMARGADWANKTNATQFGSMEDRIRIARENFAAALACNPSLTPAWSGLIQAAMLTSDDELAKHALEKGLAAQPTSLTIRRSYLSTLAPKWGGSLEAADAFVEQSRPALSPAAFAILEGAKDEIHADQLVADGRREEALSFQNRAVERSDHWASVFDRGVNLSRLGRAEAALADFDRALEKRPDSVPILAERSRVLDKLGRGTEALADIDAALAFDDRNPNFLEFRSYLMTKSNRPQDAMEDTRAALALGDQRARSWSNLGYALRIAKKRPAEAREAFLKAIELDPDYAPSWYGYGLTLYDEQSSSALDAFDHYVYLCGNRGSQCPPEDLQWLAQLVRSPSIYSHWPRLVLRAHLMGLLL